MKKSIILSLSLLVTQAVFARDINVPGDYNNIQAAIDASADGDRILIAAGNYSGYLNINKSIKLIGTAPCKLYANNSPILSARNPKALINVADNEVSIHNIGFVGTYLNNGASKGSNHVNSYCQVGVDSKDALLDLKSVNFNGFTKSFFLVDGGMIDVVDAELGSPSSVHPSPSVAFILDDVSGVTIDGVKSVHSSVKNFMVINEIYTGSRNSLIVVKETEVGSSVVDKGRKDSYTLYFTEKTKKVAETFSKITGEGVVAIPDVNFKKYLVNNKDINTNGDQEIQLSEASSFTGKIECTYLGINDMTGIEAFTSITELFCILNNITSLDVSKNTELTYIHCKGNKITSLDVSNNPKITDLWCSGNKITSLDLRNNPALKTLMCHGNKLTSLNISKNTKLRMLVCQSNNLTKLDLSKNVNLEELSCSGNQLSVLDVSKNNKLTVLSCSRNLLKSLDVKTNTSISKLVCSGNNLTSLNVSENKQLKTLDVSKNQLKSINLDANNLMYKFDCGFNQIGVLDLRKCTNLTLLYCGGNKLMDLDLRGNKKMNELGIAKSPQLEIINMIGLSNMDDLFAKENPNLFCVLVDDIVKAQEDWSKSVENVSVFKSNCEGDEVIPDDMVPVPPAKTESTNNDSKIEFYRPKFVSTVDGKDYSYVLPNTITYIKHQASGKYLIVSYIWKESGENFVGLWSNKMEYKGEYNFKKIEVKSAESFVSSNGIDYVLIHYFDPNYKTEYVGVFDNMMKYVGQYNLTGKKNIKIVVNGQNPRASYEEGGKKKMVEFDSSGKKIAITNR